MFKSGTLGHCGLRVKGHCEIVGIKGIVLDFFVLFELIVVGFSVFFLEKGGAILGTGFMDLWLELGFGCVAGWLYEFSSSLI